MTTRNVDYDVVFLNWYSMISWIHSLNFDQDDFRVGLAFSIPQPVPFH